MEFKLVVVRPFGGHPVGTVLTDGNLITATLAGEHAGNVVRVAVPAAAVKEG